MADPRGISFSEANRGLATILPGQEAGFFNYASNVEQMRLAAEAGAQKRKQEARDAALKDVKDGKAWRWYSDSLSKMTNEIIEYAGTDDFDETELSMRVGELAALKENSLQLQNEVEAAQQAYKETKDLYVNPEEWFYDTYFPDNSVDSLRKVSKEGINPFGFLNEVGGSARINKTTAFQNVLNTAFKEWVQQRTLTPEGRARYGNVVNQFTERLDEQKFKQFARVNPQTGKLEVRNPDELIADGVLDVFMGDENTARIIEDAAIEIAGDAKTVTDEHRAEALRNFLVPYSGVGSSTTETRSRFVNDYFDAQGQADRETKQDATAWLEDVRNGNPQALGYLEGSKTTEGIVTGGEFSPIRPQGGAPENPFLTFQTEGGEMQEGFNIRDMNDEQLLRFYSAARSNRKYRYGQFRSGGELDNQGNTPIKKGILD